LKTFEPKDDEEVIEALMRIIEEDTGKEIFTMRVIDHTDDGLESIIVFKDESIIMGTIKVHMIGGKMALRMQANFI
jgi:hypothetical protein